MPRNNNQGDSRTGSRGGQREDDSRSMSSRSGGLRGRSSRGSVRGQGRGWFGDSEGHAEAGRHNHDNN